LLTAIMMLAACTIGNQDWCVLVGFPSMTEGAAGLGDETVRHPQTRFAFKADRISS